MFKPSVLSLSALLVAGSFTASPQVHADFVPPRPSDAILNGYAKEIFAAVLADGIQPGDLIQMTKRAEKMVSNDYVLSYSDRVSAVSQVLTYVVDMNFTSPIPHFLLDPAIKAMLVPLVKIFVTDDANPQADSALAGHPTTQELAQYVDSFIQNTGSYIQLKDMPKCVNAFIAHAKQFSEMTIPEKNACAKYMYNDFLEKTDTARVPDFLVDPILNELGAVMIDEMLSL